MPYFRKASALAEIGWDFNQQGEFLAQKNLERNLLTKSDTKYVPLLLCHLTRPTGGPSGNASPVLALATNGKLNDSRRPSAYRNNTCIIEIHSPDWQHTCVLRCPDTAQCSAWFSAIHAACCQLMSHAVSETNNILKEFLEGAELKHMGWLFEKVSEPFLKICCLIIF